MCQKVLFVILAMIFVYITGTVAAFVYLEWWQALLTSALLFVFIVFLSKVLLKRFVRSMGRRAQEMFTKQAMVLKNATIEVHSIKATIMPSEVSEGMLALKAGDDDEYEDDEEEDVEDDYVPENYQDYRWHTVELTIFPVVNVKKKADRAAAETWMPSGLKIVPFEAKPIQILSFKETEEDHIEYDLWEIKMIEDGIATEPDESTEGYTGSRRLRFVLGTRPEHRLLKLQYYSEQFGRIELPVTFNARPKS